MMGTSVLVLAGVELVFFTLAIMGLCFEFVLKTVLVTQGCLVPAEQCSHRAKASSAPHPTPPASWLGVHRELGGGTAGTADPD